MFRHDLGIFLTKSGKKASNFENISKVIFFDQERLSRILFSSKMCGNAS